MNRRSKLLRMLTCGSMLCCISIAIIVVLWKANHIEWYLVKRSLYKDLSAVPVAHTGPVNNPKFWNTVRVNGLVFRLPKRLANNIRRTTVPSPGLIIDDGDKTVIFLSIPSTFVLPETFSQPGGDHKDYVQHLADLYRYSPSQFRWTMSRTELHHLDVALSTRTVLTSKRTSEVYTIFTQHLSGLILINQPSLSFEWYTQDLSGTVMYDNSEWDDEIAAICSSIMPNNDNRNLHVNSIDDIQYVIE